MNSNSAYKNILENNKEFIDTLNNILKDIIRKRKDYINLENRISGRSFEREENNKRDFNTFIYFDLEKELTLEKYDCFFSKVDYYEKIHNFETDVVFLKDKNDFIWAFRISDFSMEFLELKKNLQEFKIVISHQKYISTIYEEEESTPFSFKSKKVLFDLSEKDLDINGVELLLLTEDIDLRPLLNFNLKNIVFPVVVNGKSLKSVYETKDEVINKKKEGLFKRIFKL